MLDFDSFSPSNISGNAKYNLRKRFFFFFFFPLYKIKNKYFNQSSKLTCFIVNIATVYK